MNNNAVLLPVILIVANSLPALSQDSSAGKWKQNVEISPIDDSKNVTLILDAESTITGWPNKSQIPTIILRCKENKTDGYIHTGMTDAGDTTEVLIRFDKYKAFTESWGNSSSGEAVFFRQKPIPFIKKMMTHDKLLFQITPFNSSPTMTTFDLVGLQEAIQPLQEACNWSTGTLTKKSYNLDAAELAIKSAFSRDYSSSTNGLTITTRTTGFNAYYRDRGPVEAMKDVAAEVSAALRDISGWKLVATVHGSSHKSPPTRDAGMPYSGNELAEMVGRGFRAAGLAPDQYTIVVGKLATPGTYNGRVTDTKEHVVTEIIGIQ